MIWQDFVISTGQLLFIVSLVPALLAKEKPTCYVVYFRSAKEE